jgi:DNA-binding NarL/FixJ family response regulator
MSENPFDLVILDLTIKGGMGGQETIRKLQEIDPNVKAVVSSGYSDDPVVSEYHNYGFQGMLNKPYTIQELEKCLNKMVR